MEWGQPRYSKFARGSASGQGFIGFSVADTTGMINGQANVPFTPFLQVRIFSSKKGLLTPETSQARA